MAILDLIATFSCWFQFSYRWDESGKSSRADVHYVMHPHLLVTERTQLMSQEYKKYISFEQQEKSYEGGRNTIYVRKVMCMCKFWVHSIYDRCLITNPWEKIIGLKICELSWGCGKFLSITRLASSSCEIATISKVMWTSVCFQEW